MTLQGRYYQSLTGGGNWSSWCSHNLPSSRWWPSHTLKLDRTLRYALVMPPACDPEVSISDRRSKPKVRCSRHKASWRYQEQKEGSWVHTYAPHTHTRTLRATCVDPQIRGRQERIYFGLGIGKGRHMGEMDHKSESTGAHTKVNKVIV